MTPYLCDDPWCPDTASCHYHRPGSTADALDALRLISNQARRPAATDAAAVRIAVRRLRGNQLT